MKTTVERELIGPREAGSYLESQTANRPLVGKRVQALAEAIKRGEWIENGETVKFNGGGVLVDGQHRLAAIVKAGKRVTVWVVRGLPSEAQETVDIGSARSVGNMLSLRGYRNANELAGCARIIWTYRNHGELYSAAAFLPPTPQQILAVVENEPMLPEWVTWGGTISRNDPALRLTKTFVAGLGFCFAAESSEEDAKTFFAELVTPLHLTDPTAVLRKRLLQQGFHSQMPPRLRLALVVKAWNAWIRGDRPTRLTWRAGGASKEAFPMILGPGDIPPETEDA